MTSARKAVRSRSVIAPFVILGVVLATYLASLLLNGSDQPAVFDLRFVAGFEIVVSTLCIARGFAGAANRAVPILVGAALMMWALGDLLLGIELSAGSFPSSPSLVDVC